MLSLLPKDLQNLVYKKLHELYVRDLNKQYRDTVKIQPNERVDELYHFTNEDGICSNKNMFNWRICGWLTDVYTFNRKENISIAPLPVGYWSYPLKID